MANEAVIANFYCSLDACMGLDGALITDDDIAAEHCVGGNGHRALAVSELNITFENRSGMDHWMIAKEGLIRGTKNTPQSGLRRCLQ